MDEDFLPRRRGEHEFHHKLKRAGRFASPALAPGAGVVITLLPFGHGFRAIPPLRSIVIVFIFKRTGFATGASAAVVTVTGGLGFAAQGFEFVPRFDLFLGKGFA